MIVILLGLAAAFTGVANAAIHTSATDHRSGEIAKTINITAKKWGQPTSVMSLPPQAVGGLTRGDFLEAAAELQVSVCLKPNPLHDGSPQPCPGKYHDFQPQVVGRVILTGSKYGTRGQTIGTEKQILCTHKQPNRNHHCVISKPWQGKDIVGTEAGCLPRCFVNFVVSAYHPNANPTKHKMTVGGMGNDGSINQGKAKLSIANHESAKNTPLQSLLQTEKRLDSIGMAPKGANRRAEVIASLRVDNLQPGDQLVVHGRSGINLSHLPYNALMRTQVILADSPSAVKPLESPLASSISDSTTRISAENGFNCTRGTSGFKSPCYLDKTGILSVRHSTNQPLYINFTVSLSAHGPATWTSQYKSSDRAYVVNDGFIRVNKYKGSSFCSTCQMTGPAKSFSEAATTREKAFVASVKKWGVTQGSYTCFERNKTEFICPWTSKGRYGNSPEYSCDQKAFATKKDGRWVFDTKPCKDALAKSLWNVLLLRGLIPDYTGVCEQNSKGATCKWFAFTTQNKYCKGLATWLVAEQRWAAEPCKV
jgi:hypothetical protein